MRRPPPPLFLSAFIALQFLLQQPNGVAAQVQYPAAQACFNAATTSAKCDDSSTAKFNPCACSNTGNWLGLSAACIGAADNSQLNAIYNSLQQNCAGTNNPIAFSLQQWLAAAGSSGSTPGTTTPVPANSPTPTILVSTAVQTSSIISTLKQTTTAPTTAPSVVTLTQSGSVSVVTLGNAQATGSSTASSSSKLSTGAIAGIAIGAVCLIALAGLAFICMRKRGQADHDSRITSPTFNQHDSGHYAGIPVAAKSPLSDATGFSDPASQSPYQQGSYYSQPLGSQPASDIPQAYSPHELPVSQPATYGESQNYSTGPPPGTLELQGQPVTRTHEMRRYGYVG